MNWHSFFQGYQVGLVFGCVLTLLALRRHVRRRLATRDAK